MATGGGTPNVKQFGQLAYCAKSSGSVRSSSASPPTPPPSLNWALYDGLPNSPDLNPMEGGRASLSPSPPHGPHSIDGGGILFMFSVSLFTSLSLRLHCSLLTPQSDAHVTQICNGQCRATPRRSKLPCAKFLPLPAGTLENCKGGRKEGVER